MFTLRSFAFALLACASSVAYGLAQRTFVSTTGDDSNAAANCSIAAPCRSFGAAIGVTAVGGELIVLDSGGYGAVTITHGVTVEAPAGVYAGISVSSGTGVAVNAPASTVTLRGLAINGLGGTIGIDVQAAATFQLFRTRVSGMAQRAIRSTAAASRIVISEVDVSDTGSTNNAVEISNAATVDAERLHVARSGGGGLYLINVAIAGVRESSFVDSSLSGTSSALEVQSVSGGTTKATVERVTVMGTAFNCIAGFGNNAGSVALLGVSDSQMAGCSTANSLNAGIRAAGFSGGIARVVVGSSVIRNGGGTGADTTGGATLSVSDSTIVDNAGFGLDQSGGGVLYSLHDNTVRGNNAQETTNQTNGVITPLTPI